MEKFLFTNTTLVKIELAILEYRKCWALAGCIM